MSVIGRVEAAIRVVREGRCDDAWTRVTPADLDALLAVIDVARNLVENAARRGEEFGFLEELEDELAKVDEHE